MYNAACQKQVKSPPQMILTWPSDASYIEPACVIGLEERFHYRPFLLAFPPDGAEQVLGIHLILHPLEAGDADQRQQNRNDEEVPWVMTHKEAQAVKGGMKGLVHPRQPTAHIELQKKTQLELQSPITYSWCTCGAVNLSKDKGSSGQSSHLRSKRGADFWKPVTD